MPVRLHAPVRELHEYHPAVFLAAPALYIFLIYQAVHGRRQGAYGNIQLLGYGGHIIAVAQPDGLDDVHVIIRKILKLFCNNGLLLQFPDLVDQVHQNIVDCCVCVFHSLLPFLLDDSCYIHIIPSPASENQSLLLPFPGDLPCRRMHRRKEGRHPLLPWPHVREHP